MIEINILESDRNIVKIDVKGHSGYADAGEDIVCASISTLIFTLIESMDGVVGLKQNQYTYIIDNEIPLISLEIFYNNLTKEEKVLASGLANAFTIGAMMSSQGYSEFINIKIQEV